MLLRQALVRWWRLVHDWPPVTAFRAWRHERPFWGGVFSILAGLEICLIPFATLSVMMHEGVAGVPSVLMGVLMILLGLSLWIAPQYSTMSGLAVIIFALASLVLSNLGGFFLGLLLGIVGGGLGFAWEADEPEQEAAEVSLPAPPPEADGTREGLRPPERGPSRPGRTALEAGLVAVAAAIAITAYGLPARAAGSPTGSPAPASATQAACSASSPSASPTSPGATPTAATTPGTPAAPPAATAPAVPALPGLLGGPSSVIAGTTSFTIYTTRLNLHGLTYDGVSDTRPGGKPAMKFTASGIDIYDLDMVAPMGGGKYAHFVAAPGSDSTFTGGTVTLYTEELTGNLLGLVPVDFTPLTPPPLTLPETFFTNATVVNAVQTGGTLTLPGLNAYENTNPGAP